MKRHPALQDLSRDHFVALNHVVDARRVVEGDAHSKGLEPVWEAFLEFIQDTLPHHFAEEEELLLPHLEAPGRDGHARRLEGDHARLRAAFGRLLAATPDAQAIWNVAEDLRVHIRWEEDELFGRLQAWLGDEELERLHEASRTLRQQVGMPVR